MEVTLIEVLDKIEDIVIDSLDLYSG